MCKQMLGNEESCLVAGSGAGGLGIDASCDQGEGMAGAS